MTKGFLTQLRPEAPPSTGASMVVNDAFRAMEAGEVAHSVIVF